MTPNPNFKTRLRLALTDLDASIRAKAARDVGILKDHDSVSQLIVALVDSNTDVRTNAVDALGNIGSRQAVEPLIAALKDESIVIHAVYALGQIGDSSAMPALRSFLITDDNKYRFRLAYSLALCGDSPAIDDLDLVCAVSEDPERVILAIYALETTCKRHPMLVSRIIPILAGRLGDRRSPRAEALNHLRAPRWVDREANRSLRNIGTPEAIQALSLL